MLQKKYLLSGIVLLVVIVLVSFLLRPAHQRMVTPPLSVSAAEAMIKPMPILLEAPGFLEPLNATSIQAQVTGTVLSVEFTEGQMVTAGQELYKIDPAPYQAALHNAQATFEQDKAQLAMTMISAQRDTDLIKQNYVSQQEYDQSISANEAQKAKVAADAALVHAAQINLDYTTIRAPIAGKISDSSVKVGDLVTTTNTTILTTIQSVSPLLVDFYLPQHNLRTILHYQQQNPIQVIVWNEPHTRQLATGTLSFIDNAVDPNTGTVLLKASIPTAVPNLWPGAKVSVEVILTVQPDALVVPSSAIQFGQSGNFVYRVEHGQAVSVPVTVDRQIGPWAVISQGLSPGDTVITAAPPTLLNQSAVRVIS